MELRKAAPSGARRVVTLSFDDGHPLDLQVAERLVARGVRATFYVACNHPKGFEISVPDLRELRRLGMEIGSHTWTHQLLTRRSRAAVHEELSNSRAVLEDILGEPVTALSYPEGCFSGMIRDVAVECGYRVARTTMAYHTAPSFDPMRMPVSVLMLPLTRYEHVRHAGRDRNIRGLLRWITATRAEPDLFLLSRILFDSVIEHGGVFHLYARSWQLEQLGLWDVFERVLDHVARWEEVSYTTNSGAIPIL
jgi:peptidoglycan-N-acetylglucosamine deacetylase